MCDSTWDLEEEVVRYRVAGPPLLDDHISQKVIVVYWNGSMIVHDQRWSFVWDLLQPVDLVACEEEDKPMNPSKNSFCVSSISPTVIQS